MLLVSLATVETASAAVLVGGEGPQRSTAAAPVTALATPAAPNAYLAARATGPSVAVYPTADATKPVADLANPTAEGFPLTFSVVGRQGGRVLVRLPQRPNGTTAWVDAAEVTTWTVPSKITVDLSDRELTVTRGEEVVMQEKVAVGKPATPTPMGDFYVDISLPAPGHPYGAHMLRVAAFSDVLFDFGGGIGQIAIHGWEDPSVTGKAVSNGCLRLSNPVVTRLAELASVGTPVEIRA